MVHVSIKESGMYESEIRGVKTKAPHTRDIYTHINTVLYCNRYKNIYNQLKILIATNQKVLTSNLCAVGLSSSFARRAANCPFI